MARLNLDPKLPIVADESIKQGTSLYTRLGPDRYELHLVGRAKRAAALAEAACLGGADYTTRKDGSHRRFAWM
jgi:hypothetical protein